MKYGTQSGQTALYTLVLLAFILMVLLQVLVTDFFGSVRNIELMNDTSYEKQGTLAPEFEPVRSNEGEMANVPIPSAYLLSPLDHLVRCCICAVWGLHPCRIKENRTADRESVCV